MEPRQPQLEDLPDAGSDRAAHQELATLGDGDRVESSYAVRERSRRPTKRGGEWLSLRIADRTATVQAKSWDEVDARFAIAEPGTVVHVSGRFERSPKWGDALIVEAMARAAEGDYDPAWLLESSPVPVERMESDLVDLIATVQNDDLRRLLDRLIAPGGDLWRRFRDAPAAKHYHQAYRHGLLEHTLSVAQGVSAAASFFPGIDRDVAVAGALLHDIGKLEAYNDNPLAIDMTDLGRLAGEIPLGYYRVRREIESIEGFDPDLGRAVLHIILSHHGTLEHGSPVTPATREATLVHMMDNLGGRLGSFDRIERTLADGEAWSGFDRGIDGSAYFRDRRAA
ncbi:MAG: HD domain-containing protein [Acidobacteria bacterium]|nr:MAG: HD domain-containing protein [Acidobacteriota bacterium]MCL4288325.1 HD domain-containing protein [Thermoleophilia bacterium]GIK76413.1 MAG: HD family phosphohydrolase [Actinomycetes bacterium]